LSFPTKPELLRPRRAKPVKGHWTANAASRAWFPREGRLERNPVKLARFKAFLSKRTLV
jgi:hypothetical protein